LAGPGDNGVGNSGLLVAAVGRELLHLDSLIAEVEETLGEAKAPVSRIY
jgi:hypothetical protein